jgi:hypothetical protein
MMFAVTQLSNEYDFGSLSAGKLDTYDQYQKDLEFARMVGPILIMCAHAAYPCWPLAYASCSCLM